MTLLWPTPGASDNGSYSAPGIPWVTGSTMPTATIVHISFPAATKFVTVRHTSGSSSGNQPVPVLSVGFTQNGMGVVQSNYFTLLPGTEEKMDIRIKDLFLSATQGAPPYEIIAGLSVVLASSFPTLTGSISGSTNQNSLFSGVG